MANIIIGIHGLGNKPSKKILKRWWKLAMKEGLKTNGYSTKLPKFELVYWADLLHENPQRLFVKDPENPSFLRERYRKASKNFVAENHNIRKKVVDFVSQQMDRIFLNKDLSLNYASLSDVIIKKYFKDLDIYYKDDCTQDNQSLCKIKDIIKDRLAYLLEKHKEDNILLLSHSMGSIIAFDVISFKASQVPISTFITIGSPLGMPIVISKIAAERKDDVPEKSILQTPPSIQKHWFNFSDILDKVAFKYKLADDFSPNKYGVSPTDFLVINDYEVNNYRNPHKSYGYLRTPEFSMVLNDFIQTNSISFSKKVMNIIMNLFSKK